MPFDRPKRLVTYSKADQEQILQAEQMRKAQNQMNIEEIAFKLRLGLLGDDILDTPPPDMLGYHDDGDGEETETEESECTGYCGRIFHYEDTNGEGMCGRCEAGLNRKRSAPVKQPRYIVVDLTEDSDDEVVYLGTVSRNE